MATTEEFLLGLGITIEEAREFILNNLDDIETIYNTCVDLGVTNSMIAEILGIEGVDGEFVSDYFDSSGFDGSALDSGMISSGTLNLDNINTYQYITLFENISEDFGDFLIESQSIPTDQYLLATDDMIGEAEDYGYTTLIRDSYGTSQTFTSPANPTSEFTVITEYSGLAQHVPGNYDLIMAG